MSDELKVMTIRSSRTKTKNYDDEKEEKYAENMVKAIEKYLED